MPRVRVGTQKGVIYLPLPMFLHKSSVLFLIVENKLELDLLQGAQNYLAKIFEGQTLWSFLTFFQKLALSANKQFMSGDN